MREYFLMKHKLTPDSSLTQQANQLWSSLCVGRPFFVPIKSCPDEHIQNLESTITGHIPHLSSGLILRTALDISYIRLFNDSHVTIPVCHHEVNLSFVDIPWREILVDEPIFEFCPNYTLHVPLPACCKSAHMPSNKFAPATFINCKDKHNETHHYGNACHPNYKGSLLNGVVWDDERDTETISDTVWHDFELVNGNFYAPVTNINLLNATNRIMEGGVPLKKRGGKKYKRCINFGKPPHKAYNMWSICQRKNISMTLYEKLSMFTGNLNDFPSVHNFTQNMKTYHYDKNPQIQLFPTAVYYWDGITADNDVLIIDMPYNESTARQYVCENDHPIIEPLNCKVANCRRCKHNLCTLHDDCVHGCKFDKYLPPKCVDVRKTDLEEPSIPTCYCNEKTHSIPIDGVNFCTGKNITQTLGTKTCWREVLSPQLPAKRSEDIQQWQQLNFTKIMLAYSSMEVMHTKAFSFPIPCHELNTNTNTHNTPWKIGNYTRQHHCNCSYDLCEGGLCTDYGGCIIGCVDKDMFEPWCNETIADHIATLMPYNAVPGKTDFIEDSDRELIIIVLSSLIGLTSGILLFLVLGQTLYHYRTIWPRSLWRRIK